MKLLIALLALTAASAAAQAPVAGKGPGTGLAAQSAAAFGDLDKMIERRVVRVLVPYSRTLYFIDKGAQRGLTADNLRDFETFLNKKFPKKAQPIVVLAIPTTRDGMISGVLEGRADIAAGNLTVTPEREAKVAFSPSVLQDIGEIVVTGPKSPKLASLDDLGGQDVHVRKSSSYHESLMRLNARLAREGKPEAKLVLVPEALEDEDLMDMVAAGLMQLTVVDGWKANVWARMQKRLKPRPDLALTQKQQIAWAFRPDSPQLAAALEEFVERYPGARAMRYRNHAAYVTQLGHATADADWKRFQETITLFRKYAPRYGFDPLLVAAQGYQESRLDQNARSHVGAIGVMQIMPDTAKTLGVGDVHHVDANVHGGIKYLRILRERTLSGGNPDEQNKTLFAIAAYNCGPGRVGALRAEAEKIGLDSDVWFNNVERVAARRVGQETVLYVRNIYKYYAAYTLQLETLEERKAAAAVYAPPKPPPAKKAVAKKPAAKKAPAKAPEV